MNTSQNQSSNYDDDIAPSTRDYLTYLFISCAIFPFILYPVFLLVHLQNRATDKQTPIYPIINHFLHIVTLSLVLTVFYGINLIWFPDWKSPFLWNIHSYGIYLLPSVLNCISQVQYILHFLLALQRFLIYFYPTSDQYLTWTTLRFYILILLMYGLSGIKEWIVQVKFPIFTEDYARSRVFEFYIYITLNILLITAALLYLPIMISVMKLTNLVSAAQQKPHYYIFCQILTHLATRITIILFLYIDHKGVGDDKAAFTRVADFFITPLTIQLAYLACNRKNIRLALDTNMDTLCRDLFCGKRALATVGPEIESTRT